MRRSVERILTTHTGSLPRPQDLLAMLEAVDAGTPPDPAEGGEGFARSQSRDAFARSRSRGRFTRNFVVQATAAEWALTVLATLRRRLAPGAARLVFFQHDEVLVHCPEPLAAEVAAAVDASAAEATRLLFGPTPVRLPFGVSVVACYADAK